MSDRRPSRPTTVIIDYGLCNLDSIGRAVEECGGRPVVTREPGALADADRVILPGVGAFAVAAANLHAAGFASALTETVRGRGIPLLGICLGLQLLARSSTEGAAGAVGLGLIDGEVVRLEPEPGERVPHVGWNAVEPRSGHPLFDGIAGGTDFYFVHSYHLRCPNDRILATTPYGGGFVSAAGCDRVMGVQFHPEKSLQAGFRLLSNFLAVPEGGRC